MAPIHPFTSTSATKFDSMFDDQPSNVTSPVNLRDGGTVPDFRDRSTESSEDYAYGILFDQAGGNLTGSLSGDRAVPFFQRSGLDSNMLYKIWQLSDSTGEGVLRLSGFKIAMKLIALAQSQLPVSLAYIREACPLPIFEGVRVNLSRPKTGSEDLRLAGRASSLSRSSPFDSSSPFDRLSSPSWNQTSQGPSISLSDSQKYYRIFRKASFNQDFLDGNAVRDIMMKSGLPIDILRDVWNLADTQDRGFLEAFEFIIAMYYVENFMNETISDVPILLPLKIKEAAILAADSFSSPYSNTTRQASFAAPAPRPFYPAPSSGRNIPIINPGLNTSRDGSIPPTSAASLATSNEPIWAIPLTERSKYYGFFDSIVPVPTALMPSDKAYVFFIKSQLPSTVLSRIWELATIENQNSLSRDEFVVAMYLIYSQLAGQTLPSQLPFDLIPPRLRKNDPYLQETIEAPIPFDPFIDSINNRQNMQGVANNLTTASFEPNMPQYNSTYAKSEDLLSFDEPSNIINNSTINSNPIIAPQSAPYKPASFSQTRDVNPSLSEMPYVQSFNNQSSSFTNNKDVSVALPSQHIQTDQIYGQGHMRQAEPMKDNPSIQSSLQSFDFDHNVSQELDFKQPTLFTVQETQHQLEKSILNDLPLSQRANSVDQATLQKASQINEQLSFTHTLPHTVSNQSLPEKNTDASPVEKTEDPIPKQDLDPFAALIETRVQPTVINNDSQEAVASLATEADPFSDPTLEMGSIQSLPQESVFIENQESLKNIKHFDSFDEIIAQRSAESKDESSRFTSFDDVAVRSIANINESHVKVSQFASFDDIALRSTDNNAESHDEFISGSLTEFTDQVVSSPPTISDFPSSSKISLPIDLSPRLENLDDCLVVSDTSSSVKHLENTSQDTHPSDDPFMVLVNSVESKPSDLKQVIDIPKEASFPSSGSVIFSAFEDDVKKPIDKHMPNITSSKELSAYLASADILSFSQCDLTKSEADLKSPELSYIIPETLFESSFLEFSLPKTMHTKDEPSFKKIQNENSVLKISKNESGLNDPFASIAQRTDPFDLPEATLDKIAKRVSGAASLRFDDAFGDDFSLPSIKSPSIKDNEHDPSVIDHVATSDPLKVPLPVSSKSLSLSNFKDPPSPEACRSASLYFDADDIISAQLSASSAAGFPDLSPQASDAMAILIAMGFPPNSAADALARFDNDTDKATHYLLDNQNSSQADALAEDNLTAD